MSIFYLKNDQCLNIPFCTCFLMNRDVPDWLSDHLPKHVRNFAAIGGYSLLWPEAATFLSHRGAYLQPEVAIVACGPRPQGFISHKSQPTPGRVVTLECSMLPEFGCFSC